MSLTNSCMSRVGSMRCKYVSLIRSLLLFFRSLRQTPCFKSENAFSDFTKVSHETVNANTRLASIWVKHSRRAKVAGIIRAWRLSEASEILNNVKQRERGTARQ